MSVLHLPNSPQAITEEAADTGTVTDGEIYDRLISAILDHRLEPGTKLIEDKLATAFGVSRTRIRPVLVRLDNESIVTLRPNRGAVVAQPTPLQAQEIFEVRRMIEPTLVDRFIMTASDADVQALRQLILDEEAAQHLGDRHRAIRLSGQFHLWIAEKSGHQTLGRVLVELVSRTSLILMTYGQTPARQVATTPNASASCGCTAHRALLDAIRLRISCEAQRLMELHLQEIESQLDWTPPTVHRNDLKTLLGI
jgi:DNA-binding GntR family transcriptional regulator